MAAAFDFFNEQALGKELAKYWASPNYVLCRNRRDYSVVDVYGNVIYAFQSFEEPTLFTYEYPFVEISFRTTETIEINVITQVVSFIPLLAARKKPVESFEEARKRENYRVAYFHPSLTSKNLLTGKKITFPPGFFTTYLSPRSTISSVKSNLIILISHKPGNEGYFLGDLETGDTVKLPAPPVFIA